MTRVIPGYFTRFRNGRVTVLSGTRRGCSFSFLEGDATFVLGDPLVEGLERGVEGSGDRHAASAAEVRFKVTFELKHVSEILGAWKTKGSVYLRRHIVVAHFLTQSFGERGGHLRSRQVFSRDADGLADEFTSFLEDAVGALANVFSCDAR